MINRQFLIERQVGPEFNNEQGSLTAQTATAEPRSVVLPHLAGARPAGKAEPERLGAALHQASGGRLARVGTALLHMQQNYGNRYVQQVVQQASTPMIQAKSLSLGPANDRYEREADRIAQQVTGPGVSAANAIQPTSVATPTVMRLPTMPGAAGGAIDLGVEQAIAKAQGGGQPLPHAVFAPMQQALGADFSQVRVHTDAAADQFNQALQARAFTTGQDIFFRRGHFAPASAAGQSLLAHELTHVVQQTGHARRQASHSAPALPKVIQRKKSRFSPDEEKTLRPYEKNYNDCKNRGEEKIWPAIAKATSSLVDQGTSAPAIGSDEKSVDAKPTNEQRFQTEYETEITQADDKNGVYEVKSAAKAKKKEDVPPVEERQGTGRLPSRHPQVSKEKLWQYTNKFNVKQKQITAKMNWADQDPTPNRLNNSEIIWFQYKVVAKRYQENTKALSPKKLRKLYKVKDVIRDNVVNEETRNVVDLAYPNGKSWRTRHSHTWKPTSPDFFAVLGTPNGQGAGWMLAQHMLEMEGRPRKITKIVAEGTRNMELKLGIHLDRD